MISNQLSAVVISYICHQSGGGVHVTQTAKGDENLATRGFYYFSNKPQLFSFPYAAHKDAGLCPDITAAELFVLGNKEFLRCLPVHKTLSH